LPAADPVDVGHLDHDLFAALAHGGRSGNGAAVVVGTGDGGRRSPAVG
jgi:hypothetical protein